LAAGFDEKFIRTAFPRKSLHENFTMFGAHLMFRGLCFGEISLLREKLFRTREGFGVFQRGSSFGARLAPQFQPVNCGPFRPGCLSSSSSSCKFRFLPLFLIASFDGGSFAPDEFVLSVLGWLLFFLRFFMSRSSQALYQWGDASWEPKRNH
jgi:hypothetical protein